METIKCAYYVSVQANMSDTNPISLYESWVERKGTLRI